MQAIAPPSLQTASSTGTVGQIGAERMQRSADRILHVRANPKEGGIDAVAKEFAGQFVHLLMKNIQPRFKPGMLGHGGMGEEVFREMMLEDLTMESSAGDPFGLATLVRESLLRQQQRHALEAEGASFPPPHLRETPAASLSGELTPGLDESPKLKTPTTSAAVAVPAPTEESHEYPPADA